WRWWRGGGPSPTRPRGGRRAAGRGRSRRSRAPVAPQPPGGEPGDDREGRDREDPGGPAVVGLAGGPCGGLGAADAGGERFGGGEGRRLRGAEHPAVDVARVGVAHGGADAGVRPRALGVRVPV